MPGLHPAPKAPTVVLELDPGAHGDGWVQRVADEQVWSDRPLAPWCRRAPRPPLEPAAIDETWAPATRGEGFVQGRIEEVVTWRGERGGRRIEFQDGERFWVSPAGERVVRLPPRGTGLGEPELVERALGAPLALALAIRGTHLLHASAVLTGGGVVALCGESGAGKSTLAAAAAARPDLGLRAVADDILPVRFGAEPLALPWFPQLKLNGGAVSGLALDPRLPLAALLEIERREGSAPPSLDRLPTRLATLALVRATVAARLFDPALLAGHFHAAGETAGALPVLRLGFANGSAPLGEALETVAGLAAILARG